MNLRGAALKKFNVLFLLFFFVYAISPLTYTAQKVTLAHQGPVGIHEHGVSLYIVKLLLSNVLVQDDPDDDQDDLGAQVPASSSHVLLKKKRAVLSSSKLKTLMLLQAMQTASHDATPFLNTATFDRTALLGQSGFYQHYVLPLHSGNSPPAA